MADFQDKIALKDIVDSGDILLFDNINPVRDGDWYLHLVHGSNMFDDIHLQAFEEVIEMYDSFNYLYESPNIATISTIAKEMKRFQAKLRRKYDYLNRDCIHSFSRGKRKQLRNIKISGKSKQKMLFGKLLAKYDTLIRTARDKRFYPIDEEKCAALEKIVFLISDKTNAKQDFRERYERICNPMYSDLRSDEFLVAAAYYLSLDKHHPLRKGVSGCSIVTGDSDIQRLVTAVYDITIKSEVFRDTLKDFPIRVFFCRGNQGILCNVDTLLNHFRMPLCDYDVVIPENCHLSSETLMRLLQNEVEEILSDAGLTIKANATVQADAQNGNAAEVYQAQ